MDLEAGLKVGQICPSCAAELNRLNVKYRMLHYCNLALSVFVACLCVAVVLISFRLLQIEERCDLPGKLDKTPQPAKTKPRDLSMFVTEHATSTGTKDRQANSSGLVHSYTEIIRRAKREAKKGKNKKRRCKNCLPAVQIEGNAAFGNDDKADLRGLWKTSTWKGQTDKKLSKLFDTTTVNYNGKIKVEEDGIYLLYAQMTLFGANKRGYHVKKGPNITPVTSCVHYADMEGETNGTTCSTMKVVNLNRDDFLYIQEIDGNSKALYADTAAFLGLVKIGSTAKS